MTKDLALCITGGTSVDRSKYATTDEFMNTVSENFKKNLKASAPKL
jgi:hypothetical protein